MSAKTVSLNEVLKEKLRDPEFRQAYELEECQEMTEQAIERIALSLLDPHPANPRLIYRDDVIEGIAAQIEDRGGFDPAYALLVRPLNGRYQIVQGHHRWKAAERAKLDEVPCWVRELSDAEAYMLLALGNVQGELSPLEIGRHALRVVELGNGGAGRKSGISQYARKLGRTQGYVTQVRQAAEVLASIKPISQLMGFLDKAQHLTAVHRAPQDLWQMLADWLIAEEKSVGQVEDMVKDVLKLDVGDSWGAFFLPLKLLAQSFIATGRPGPDEVKAIAQLAGQIKSIIEANRQELGDSFPFTAEGFEAWLIQGIGAGAWEKQAMQDYLSNVVAAAQAARKPAAADVKVGEWYRLGRHLLYCGDTGKAAFWEHLPDVPFAFADPPYNADTADWDRDFVWEHDWLQDKAAIVAVTPGIGSLQRFFRQETQMPYRWAISAWIDNGMTRGALGFGNWIYIALFTQDASLYRTTQDQIRCSIKPSEKIIEYKGKKPSALLEQLLELFTELGDMVIDPFLGAGTTLFAADALGRRCIAGEKQVELCNAVINLWQEKTGQRAEELDDFRVETID